MLNAEPYNTSSKLNKVSDTCNDSTLILSIHLKSVHVKQIKRGTSAGLEQECCQNTHRTHPTPDRLCLAQPFHHHRCENCTSAVRNVVAGLALQPICWTA